LVSLIVRTTAHTTTRKQTQKQTSAKLKKKRNAKENYCKLVIGVGTTDEGIKNSAHKVKKASMGNFLLSWKSTIKDAKAFYFKSSMTLETL